jgi:branched-chain amino acid transport system substrate-binding protein
MVLIELRKFIQEGGKRMIRSTTIIGIVCLLLVAAVPFSHGGLAGGEIKIGVIVPKSGWGAEEGQYEEQGAMLALEEINAKGGIEGVPLKLVIYDNNSNGTQSINVAKKLIYEDKVLAILGPAFSSQVEVTFPVANRGKTPMTATLSTKPGIAEKNRPWAFRNSMGSEKVYIRLVERWAKDHSIKKVAIIYDAKDRFSQADGKITFPNACKDLGIEVVTSVTYMTNDIDFSAQLTKIQSQKPDGIIISGLRTEAAQIVKQARQKGIRDMPIAGGYELVGPRFLELAGKDAEGVYSIHPTWILGNPDPMMQEFVKKIKEKYGTVPNVGHVRIYDAIYMTKYIIEKMAVTNKPEDLAEDREEIRKGWETLKDYRGVEGLTSMDEKGDGIKETYLLVAKEGRFQRLE